MKLHQHRYYGISLFLVAIVGLWACSLAGFLELPDGHLYNGLVRLNLSAKAPARVLLVETDQSQDQGQVYAKLLQRLLDLGATRVVFTALPETGREDFLRSVAGQFQVNIGRRVLGTEGVAAGLTLEPWPGTAAEIEQYSGLVARPPAAFGLYRRQRAFVSVAGQNFRSEERRVG